MMSSTAAVQTLFIYTILITLWYIATQLLSITMKRVKARKPDEHAILVLTAVDLWFHRDNYFGDALISTGMVWLWAKYVCGEVAAVNFAVGGLILYWDIFAILLEHEIRTNDLRIENGVLVPRRS